jgi:hypothetical protein
MDGVALEGEVELNAFGNMPIIFDDKDFSGVGGVVHGAGSLVTSLPTLAG